MSAATATAPAVTAAELFAEAFGKPRDPRSHAYKQGVLAALKFRIDSRRIARLYEPGSAEDDAFYAGIAEGHAIWRRAQQDQNGGAA